MKWSAREHVIDTRQKSLACTEDTMQAKNDAHSVRFSSVGMVNTARAVGMS